jgi:hypothetical protein
VSRLFKPWVGKMSRFGFSTDQAGPTSHLVSALSPKATQLLRTFEMTRSAITGSHRVSFDHFVGAAN